MASPIASSLFKGTSPPTFVEEGGKEQPPLEKSPNHAQDSQGIFSNTETRSKADADTDADISWKEIFRSRTEVAAATPWQDREQPVFKFRQYTRSMKRNLFDSRTLTLELRLPTVLMNTVPARYREMGEEFTHCRYMAATCDPDDFTLENGFILRPAIYERHTELLVGITYYNEDKSLFCRTLHNIMTNVRDIVNQKKFAFWNKDGSAWEKIVVCILMDGIESCDAGVLDVLATLGIYQHGVAKNMVNSDQQLIPPGEEAELEALPPVQMMLCVKEKNSKKINSHPSLTTWSLGWLFHAFARILNPEIVICLDAGTRPEEKSLLQLWSAFHHDRHLGGCCGQIRAMTGPGLSYMLKPLVASQRFEYKIACILDLALETTFGYVSVLPGAFSAYRYAAVRGRPLEQYFQGDFTLAERLGKKGVYGMNAFTRNMFLADDRILSFELVMKQGERWRTGYVKGASAETDIPEDLVDFIDQRRRWINGAFAAACYSIVNFRQIYKTNHSIFQMAVLHFQLLYNIVALLLQWFGIAGFLLTTFVITDIAGSPPPGTHTRAFPFGDATPIFNAVMQFIYMMTVILQFLMALGNKARCERWAYVTSFAIFGVIQLYFILNILYLMVRVIKIGPFDTTGGGDYNYIQHFYAAVGNWTVLVTCSAVCGVYYAASFLHADMWHMFDSYAQYLFVVSSYTNILNVYAFSNWHDVSWGEKGGKQSVQGPGEHMLPNTGCEKLCCRHFKLDIPTEILDIDSAFEASVKRALLPYEKEKVVDRKPSVEESFKLFRTRLVALYVFSNFLLCIAVVNEGVNALRFMGGSFERKVWFFKIWLWATAGVFSVRFVGSFWFLVMSWWRLCFVRK